MLLRVTGAVASDWLNTVLNDAVSLFSQGSVLLWPPSREVWFSYLPEMLLVCNEAARRYAQKNSFKRKNDADGVQSKPLGLEYIADR